MSRNQSRRDAEALRQRANRTMMLIFMAVFFIGLFLQIAMAARLMRQNRRMQALQADIVAWTAQASNLELALSQYKNLDRVADQAARMGMDLPTEGQIRVVNVPDIVRDTSAQSAGEGAGK